MKNKTSATLERIAITSSDVTSQTIEQFIESLVENRQSKKPNLVATVIDCAKLYENGAINFNEQLGNVTLHKVLKQSVKSCGPGALSVKDESVWLRNFRRPSEIRTKNFATDRAKCQLLQKHKDIHEKRAGRDATALTREVEEKLFKVTDAVKFRHSAYHIRNVGGTFFNQAQGNAWNFQFNSDSKIASSLNIDEPGSLIPIYGGDASSVIINYGPDVKLWTLFHPSDRDMLRLIINDHLAKHTKSKYCCTAYRHGNVYFSLKSLDEHGLRYVQLVQQPREMIVIYPKVFYQGINVGMNVSESVNVLFSSSLIQAYFDTLAERESSVHRPCLKCRKSGNLLESAMNGYADKRGTDLKGSADKLRDKPIEVKSEPIDVTDEMEDEGVMLDENDDCDSKLIELEERIKGYIVNRPSWRALTRRIEEMPLNHFRWLSYWCCDHFKPVGVMPKDDVTVEDLGKANKFVNNLMREINFCRLLLGCNEIDGVLSILANHTNWKYKGEALSYY